MKKKSVIQDIFHGVRGGMETMYPSKEDIKCLDTLSDTYDEMLSKLSPELCELQQRFIEALEKNHLSEIDFFYTEGFKLGVLLGIECMEE